jgi:hypothetical protein
MSGYRTYEGVQPFAEWSPHESVEYTTSEGGTKRTKGWIDPETRKGQAKLGAKAEYGTANIKAIQKMRQREALGEAEKYERKAERQEARLRDPQYMAKRMGEARRAALGDFARASTGGQQADLARAAMGGADARRVAETARQAARGQQEAQAQAAVAGGQQAGQAALQAQQAIAQQLRQREAAKMAEFMGAPPVTFTEQLGQGAAQQGVAGGIQAAGYGAMGAVGDQSVFAKGQEQLASEKLVEGD